MTKTSSARNVGKELLTASGYHWVHVEVIFVYLPGFYRRSRHGRPAP